MAAGTLGETFNAHVPFWVGSGAVLLAAGVLLATRPYLRHIDDEETPDSGARAVDQDKAIALTVGSDS